MRKYLWPIWPTLSRIHWTCVAAPGIALICNAAMAAITGLPATAKEKIAMPMIVASQAFKHDGLIPARHTCDGLNISPLLKWTGVPVGTKSLALTVDDPDATDPGAPKMTWGHWVVYNIPPDANGLPETMSAEGLPRGALQGLNDWQNAGYQGPCPPIGKHRYFFKLYALDIVLPNMKHPVKPALGKAIQGHVPVQFSLVGLYKRQ